MVSRIMAFSMDNHNNNLTSYLQNKDCIMSN